MLEFDHLFLAESEETGMVRIRIDGGPWINVHTATATSTSESHATIDLSARAAGHSDVRIQFRYPTTGTEVSGWSIDNLSVHP